VPRAQTVRSTTKPARLAGSLLPFGRGRWRDTRRAGAALVIAVRVARRLLVFVLCLPECLLSFATRKRVACGTAPAWGPNWGAIDLIVDDGDIFGALLAGAESLIQL